MLKLFIKISIVVLLSLVLSIGVDLMYRQVYGLEYKFPRNIFLHPEIAEKYKLVILGNSHSEDGLTYEKINVNSLRLASVAQTYEYDLALLKMHSRQIEDNAVIIINVSPISFSQKKPKSSDNPNTQYYDGRLSPFLIPHLNLSEYLQVQIVPFIRSGYLWRTKYTQDTTEKAMSSFAENFKIAPEELGVVLDSPSEVNVKQQGKLSAQIEDEKLPKSEKPTYNVTEIYAELNAPPDQPTVKLEESTRFMVNKWNSSGGFDTESFETNRQDLQQIIDYCLEHNWRPVLVTFPLNQALLNGLGDGYLDRYIYNNLEKIDTRDIPYINLAANTQLTQKSNLYSNSDHLNKRGAAIASYVILQKLIEMNYLPKEADGYDYTRKRMEE